MSLLTRLALADLRGRPGRAVVTSFAVVASAAVVVWVVAGYDALTEKIGEVGEEYFGRYDAAISGQALDPALLAALRADPDVTEMEPVSQARAVLTGPRGSVPERPQPSDEGAGDDDGYGGEGAYLDGDDSAGAGRHAHDRPPVAVEDERATRWRSSGGSSSRRGSTEASSRGARWEVTRSRSPWPSGEVAHLGRQLLLPVVHALQERARHVRCGHRRRALGDRGGVQDHDPGRLRAFHGAE